MIQLRRFQRLTPARIALLSKVLILLLSTKGLLRLFGFQGCRSFLARLLPQLRPGLDGRPMDWKEVMWCYSRATRLLFPVTRCLEQALVLWLLLRRRDVPVELMIGVRKKEGIFEAHAWVEHRGAVIQEEEIGSYVRFEMPSPLAHMHS